MKKFLLLLFISLNLLKAESMCNKVDIGEVYNSFDNEFIGMFLYNLGRNELSDKKITQTQIFNLLGPQIHSMQIKRSEKESICVYKLSFDVSKIQITPQEVEKFEKFKMEKSHGQYTECDKRCINALKLAKFNNKTDALIYNNNKNLDYFIMQTAGERLAYYEENDINVVAFIYGKPQSGIVYALGRGYNVGDYGSAANVENFEFILKRDYDPNKNCNDECRQIYKEIESIVKWAKSVEKGTEKSAMLQQSTTNSSQNSATPSPATSTNASDNLPSLKLATKDDYVNLRKAPSGEILTPIYKKDFDKITLKKLDGGNEKWLKVLYFPPSVTDENKAITGYIHISQIAK